MTQRKTRVYVAGPLSKPDPVQNTHNAITFGQLLLERGYCPFVPHTTLAWHLVCPNDYEVWMEWDFEWLKTCDALLRLHGESPGADREVALANSLGIPVFHQMSELERELLPVIEVSEAA